MQNCLAIDVAKGKSMVTLISFSGEVLIDPYEINHSINDFTNLLNRIKSFKLEDISVIMESTNIYHHPFDLRKKVPFIKNRVSGLKSSFKKNLLLFFCFTILHWFCHTST